MSGAPLAARRDNSGGDRITRVEQDQDGVEVPYQLYLPPNYDQAKRYPLVLCLHGAGEMKSGKFEAQTAASSALRMPKVSTEYPAFILIPQTTIGWVRRPGSDGVKPGAGMSDTPESASLKLVVKGLSDVMQHYSVDPDRVYVSGQSMGGVATWDLIVRHPDLFAAAVPVCGIGDPSQAAKIRCPVWNFHGAKDPTVPVSHSRDMVAAMKAAGGSVKYTEFPDVEHGSWKPAWQDKELLPWLFSQKRPAD
ncbi:MAG TPA: prolyl oligopeptidase family serine peptidase [Pirellulales bacterium]|nr:prolyl oligopeptidase family serine peptidase [Pirellulales bacterium]